jgi:hypothetical protein
MRLNLLLPERKAVRNLYPSQWMHNVGNDEARLFPQKIDNLHVSYPVQTTCVYWTSVIPKFGQGSAGYNKVRWTHVSAPETQRTCTKSGR